MTDNRSEPLSMDKNVRLTSNSSKETYLSSKTLGGLKLISISIDSIRGKKLDLMAFLEVHQPHVVAIQETKIDSSVATSELFPETCQYKVFKKDRHLHGGGVFLSSIRTFRTCPCLNWKTTRNRFGQKYLQINLPIM